MGVCGNVCCVAAVVKDNVFYPWGVVYVRGVMNVVFSVCIVTPRAVGDRVWEVRVFRHADVVCLCLVCILWQFSLLHSARLAVCQCWSRMQATTIWKMHTSEPVP